jgi:uncharacterized protein
MERPDDDAASICSLSDGRAGNVRQADALANALGPAHAIALAPHWPWRALAPRRMPGSEYAFGADFARALDAPPALAIGCGRQAALATRLLREHGSRCVQILDPRIDPAHWDLLVVPQHDGLRGANVLTTLGSLHPVDAQWLARARVQFAAFERLPRPRTAVLVGGSSHHVVFDRAALDAMTRQIDAVLARDGGSVLLTASRRTPDALRHVLRQRYAETAGLAWLGPADGENPYAGMVAWADRIVCSPDSVNMISEACATDAPVHVFDPGRAHGRLRTFLDSLLALGRIRAADDVMAPFDAEPLRETARIAGQVRQRLSLP